MKIDNGLQIGNAKFGKLGDAKVNYLSCWVTLKIGECKQDELQSATEALHYLN